MLIRGSGLIPRLLQHLLIGDLFILAECGLPYFLSLMLKYKLCPDCLGAGEMMNFIVVPGGGPVGVMRKCDTCGGGGNIPDDDGPEKNDVQSHTEDKMPIRGNWVWDRLDSDLLTTLLFLLLPFLGGAQELFRFTSTSQFICIDTSVVSEREEWHTETEVYAEGDRFVLASRSENRPHTIYYNITWDVQTPRLLRGHDPIGRVYEWHKTEDCREFNGIDWITVEGENFARIYGGRYDFRFYEDWWTLIIQKR
jgi:hypothetical protein